MGIDMYLVEYKNATMPRSYEFFDMLQTNFTMDSGNHTYIEQNAWNEFLGEHPELLQKFKEEIDRINTLLKESEYNAIEVTFS
jgi:hypothetical protein